MEKKAGKNIHASGLLYGDIGILIRGASGSGKSLLTLSLLEFASISGRSAILIGDDRLDVFVRQDRLIMGVPASLAGKVELAGRGIIERPYRESAPVSLLVDLVEKFERMPDAGCFKGSLMGIRIASCPVPSLDFVSQQHQLMLVLEAVRALESRALSDGSC